MALKKQNPGSRREDFDQCLVGVGVGRRSLKKTQLRQRRLLPSFYCISHCHSEVDPKSTWFKKLRMSLKPFILMIICLTRKTLPFLKLPKTWKVWVEEKRASGLRNRFQFGCRKTSSQNIFDLRISQYHEMCRVFYLLSEIQRMNTCKLERVETVWPLGSEDTWAPSQPCFLLSDRVTDVGVSSYLTHVGLDHKSFFPMITCLPIQVQKYYWYHCLTC